MKHLAADPPRDLGVEVPAETWARLVEQYDGVFNETQLRRHVIDHLGDDWGDELVALVRRFAPHARDVMDVGCGFGPFVAAAERSGMRVLGLDLAWTELDVARRRVGAAAVVQADATRAPLRTGSADVVTLWHVLEHVTDRTAVFEEAWRALRPGGLLFAVAPNYGAFRMEAHYHVPWIPGLRGRPAAAWLRLLGRNPSFFLTEVQPCTAHVVHRELLAAGFDVRDLTAAKLDDPALIRNRRLRSAVEGARRAGLGRVTRLAVGLHAHNPLRGSIRVVASKPR